MKLNSKKFYEIISKRRSVRDFDSKKFDLKIIKNAIIISWISS